MERNIKILNKLLLLGVFVFGLFINFSIAANSYVFEKEAHQQEIEVTGKVTDAQTGDPLPGVNIVVEGTTIGTTTDMDGNYSIEASADAMLIYSFVGYQRQNIEIAGRQNIDVELTPTVEEMEEVVVTGLGISREKKSLGYSVSQVGGEDASRVTHDNVINSLSGRVTGVSISSTSSAPGASVNMIVRGQTSLAGDNQPLFVIDGIPVNNELSSNAAEMGSRNYVDYGNAISDLNPEDIESISILKGPSAAALYGSRAGDGVVQITTKSGRTDEPLNVQLTTGVEFKQPYRFYEHHNQFAAGYRPTPPPGVDIPQLDEASTYQMGLPLDKGNEAIVYDVEKEDWVQKELVSYPDNFKNFVQTGITNNNNLSITGGSSNSNYRVSVTNMTNKGIIPNSDFNRSGLNLSGGYDITNNLTISTNVNIGKTHSDNRPAQNRGTNPLHHVLYHPAYHDITKLKDVWSEGQEDIQQRMIPDHNNPYWLAHEVENSFFRDRIMGNLQLDWQITSGISLMGRATTDRYSEERETQIPWSYTREPKGYYGLQKIYKRENNAEFRATHDKDLGGFSVNTSVGGNIMYRHNTFYQNESTAGLTVPGLYNVDNINPLSLNYNNSLYRKAIYSVYGKATLGYEDMLYLDITGRNDWSSTLPEENRSYFYPSASLSVLINNMIELPSSVSLLKLRGGWAQVGSDTDPYRLQATLYNAGSWGGTPRLNTPGHLLNPDLKPEIATSREFGTDIALFENRLRFEGTYYTDEKENQILNVNMPISSGYGSRIINAGLVESEGWEAGLGFTPIKSNILNWDMNFTFTRQRTKIVELAQGVEHYQLWSDAKGGAITFVGEEIGIIRDRAIRTVTDETSEYYGWPLLDSEGFYQSLPEKPAEMDIIGNFNPDFTLGMQTSVSYKDFTLNMNIEWRKGGDFVSQTYRYTESDLISQRWLDEVLINMKEISDIPEHLRSNPEKYIKGLQIVGGPTEEMGGFYNEYGDWGAYDGTFNTGVYGEYDEEGNLIGYVENLGDPEKTKFIPASNNYLWSFTRAATFPADFLKLREISLSYQVPINQVFESLSISLYSSNILLWTKAGIAIDPENAFQPGNGRFKQGIERYNVTPWTVPIGIKLNIGF